MPGARLHRLLQTVRFVFATPSTHGRVIYSLELNREWHMYLYFVSQSHLFLQPTPATPRITFRFTGDGRCKRRICRTGTRSLDGEFPKASPVSIPFSLPEQ